MINHKTLPLFIGFALMLMLGLLHLSATFFYLYWVYWWFDWLMHFLAGFAGGFVAYWFFMRSGLFLQRRIFSVFVVVLIVGVAWEFFEYFNGITDSHEGYALDVTVDLILDSAGAILAGFIAKRISSNG